MRIAIDMDEVITDTHAAKYALYAARGYAPSDTELEGRKLDEIAPRELFAEVETEMQQGAFFAGIAPVEGALEGLRALYDRYEVFIATAAMDYPASCAHKIAWLRRHAPFVDIQRIVLCGDKAVINADLLIDDSPRHFERFAGQGICFSALHNHGEEVVHRARDWPDAVALVERLAGEQAR